MPADKHLDVMRRRSLLLGAAAAVVAVPVAAGPADVGRDRALFGFIEISKDRIVIASGRHAIVIVNASDRTETSAQGPRLTRPQIRQQTP